MKEEIEGKVGKYEEGKVDREEKMEECRGERRYKGR